MIMQKVLKIVTNVKDSNMNKEQLQNDIKDMDTIITSYSHIRADLQKQLDDLIKDECPLKEGQWYKASNVDDYIEFFKMLKIKPTGNIQYLSFLYTETLGFEIQIHEFAEYEINKYAEQLEESSEDEFIKVFREQIIPALCED